MSILFLDIVVHELVSLYIDCNDFARYVRHIGDGTGVGQTDVGSQPERYLTDRIGLLREVESMISLLSLPTISSIFLVFLVYLFWRFEQSEKNRHPRPDHPKPCHL